jgi:hypothetical protein
MDASRSCKPVHDIEVTAYDEGQGAEIPAGGDLVFSDQDKGPPGAPPSVDEAEGNGVRVQGRDPTLLLDLVKGFFEEHLAVDADAT